MIRVLVRRATPVALLLTAMLTLAPMTARAEVVTLNCGNVFVIDTSAGTIVDHQSGQNINLTNVAITDGIFSGVWDNGAYHVDYRIDRTSGILTMNQYCLPGGCSSISPSASVQCTKIPNKAF